MITRNKEDFKDVDFEKGETILIDKSIGKSSFNAIYKIRKKINVKKVGHAGSLDPNASGLLIVCTGKKTKEIDKYLGLNKTYVGSFLLGKKTPSMDSETEAVEEKDYSNITEADIAKVRDEFIGVIKQTPPMYSAVKHKGKALYLYARKGKTVEREPRVVKIERFDILNIELPRVDFEIECSKGTYIRVIANDFGEKLGCGGYLQSLRRIKVGDYRVEEALKVDEFSEMFDKRCVSKDI